MVASCFTHKNSWILRLESFWDLNLIPFCHIIVSKYLLSSDFLLYFDMNIFLTVTSLPKLKSRNPPKNDGFRSRGCFCCSAFWVSKAEKMAVVTKSKFVLANCILKKLVGGWTNPFEKYARQIGSFPNFRDEKKNVWVATTQFKKWFNLPPIITYYGWSTYPPPLTYPPGK